MMMMTMMMLTCCNGSAEHVLFFYERLIKVAVCLYSRDLALLPQIPTCKYIVDLYNTVHNIVITVVVVALVEHWTRDRKVAGSTPGRGAIKSTRSTQFSIPPACMAGVKAGCVLLCRVAGNTV